MKLEDLSLAFIVFFFTKKFICPSILVTYMLLVQPDN